MNFNLLFTLDCTDHTFGVSMYLGSHAPRKHDRRLPTNPPTPHNRLNQQYALSIWILRLQSQCPLTTAHSSWLRLTSRSSFGYVSPSILYLHCWADCNIQSRTKGCLQDVPHTRFCMQRLLCGVSEVIMPEFVSNITLWTQKLVRGCSSLSSPKGTLRGCT